MRLLITADLHYNHGRSRALAGEVIERINKAGGDVLLVVGDTAAADGDDLEKCLSLFRFPGPKLFVAGNHELWTRADDSYKTFTHDLPRRVQDLGWRWLQTDPFIAGDLAILGSIGWYDYSYAPQSLGIPHRFYQHKISPGTAGRFAEYAGLLDQAEDIPAASRQFMARWNDGKFVKLHRSDEEFLEELLLELERQLLSVADCRQIIAAIHHVPFPELLPPSRGGQWDFARAYLGSPRMGELLARFPAVSNVFCGHSHFPMEAQHGKISAVNIGSGYHWKTFHVLQTTDLT